MRETTPADCPALMQMYFDYWIENRENYFQRHVVMDLLWAKRYLDAILANPDSIGFIDDDGVCLGIMVDTWFGPNRIAQGIMWYVTPRARGRLLAWRLLKAFDKEARQRGALVTLNALLNSTFEDRVGGILEASGYKKMSLNYVKEHWQ